MIRPRMLPEGQRELLAARRHRLVIVDELRQLGPREREAMARALEAMAPQRRHVVTRGQRP